MENLYNKENSMLFTFKVEIIAISHKPFQRTGKMTTIYQLILKSQNNSDIKNDRKFQERKN